MLPFDRAQPLGKLRRCLEFRRQAFFQRIGGNLTSRQKPVKFRGRQIQIQHDLLELRTIHTSQLVRAGESGDDGSCPVGQSAGSR
jgi:hypothetical protein